MKIIISPKSNNLRLKLFILRGICTKSYSSNKNQLEQQNSIFVAYRNVM